MSTVLKNDRSNAKKLVDAATWDARDIPAAPPPPYDTGRELFALFRHHSDLAEQGASPILAAMEAEL